MELVEIETKRQRVLTPGKDTQTKDEACKSPALQKITLSHVAKVVSEVYTSNLSSNSQGKESLPLQQKVLICTLLLLLKKEKSKEITLPKVGYKMFVIIDVYCSISISKCPLIFYLFY